MEDRFRVLLDAAPDAMMIVDAGGRIIHANHQTERLFGYEREELLGQSIEILVPQRHRSAHLAHRATYESNPRVRAMGLGLELQGVRKDGTEFPVEISLSPVQTEAGLRVISAIRDVSDRKRLEEDLRLSQRDLEARVAARTAELVRANRALEQEIAQRRRAQDDLSRERDRARSYLDIAGVALLALDRAGRITLINIRGQTLLGYSESELLGKNWFETCMPAHVRAEAMGTFQKLLGGELVEHWEGPVLTRGGEERLVYWYNSLVRDPVGNILGTLSSGEDVTERKRLEAQFRQAHKMEAIGRLAGGIAHDFNNLMGVVLGDSQLLLADARLEAPQRTCVEEIREAGDRAASLTRQLLAFSRQQFLETRVLSLNHSLTSFKTMLERLLGPAVNLIFELQPDLGLVRADPSQFLQLVLNLIVNSRDAMPRGGQIKLATTNVDLDMSFAASHPGTQPGPHVLLTVSDNGAGMDQETLSHIFEPFFTTKRGEQGTGMGLAIVYGIVEQSGGTIWAYSERNRGTVFKIYLPRIEGAEEASWEADSLEELPRGTETVLLVEDAGLLRRVTREFLQQIGYTVLTAGDGAEAMEASKHCRHTIHLLLTDLAMPGMNGQELAGRLLAERPEMKVLYTSGYAGKVTQELDTGNLNAAFIEKPYTWQDLARKVRRLLDQP
ncbi:MAG TPA: PAS domain S-box protein [Candidatus Acidoferrales bacterium]|nr:PAS domain S-box protein [Candidatus Acidoferrales bacterium]